MLLAHSVAADAAEACASRPPPRADGRPSSRGPRRGTSCISPTARRPAPALERRSRARPRQAASRALLIPIRTPPLTILRTPRRARRCLAYLCDGAASAHERADRARGSRRRVSCVWNDCACVGRAEGLASANADHVVDRLRRVVARRAGRGLRRDHDPVERVGARLQRRLVDWLRHHRPDRAAVRAARSCSRGSRCSSARRLGRPPRPRKFTSLSRRRPARYPPAPTAGRVGLQSVPAGADSRRRCWRRSGRRACRMLALSNAPMTLLPCVNG